MIIGISYFELTVADKVHKLIKHHTLTFTTGSQHQVEIFIAILESVEWNILELQTF